MAPSKTAARTKAKGAAARKETKGAPARTKTPAARKLKHQQDPDTIRIVPLHVAGDAEHPIPEALAAGPAAAPHLTYRGGPLLTAVKVFTIFWGAAWTGAHAALVTKVNAFFDYVLSRFSVRCLTSAACCGSVTGGAAGAASSRRC